MKFDALFKIKIKKLNTLLVKNLFFKWNGYNKSLMLYLVPSPIGNLGDMTYRAVEVLKNVDKILVEDTRRSRILLNHYAIEKPITSYHSHNEHQRTEAIIENLKNGETIALISDAGTPGIADPAYLLVKKCIENTIKITCLPGPTALIPALVVSGFHSQQFVFAAFLPHKKGRHKRLEQLVNEEKTIILYESPYRLLKTLKDLASYLGEDRIMCVCRELSKKFEELTRGTLKMLIETFEKHKIKGEFVLVLEGKYEQLKKTPPIF